MGSGIYIIQNLLNHKVYIGSAINLRYRRIRHFADLESNRHKNRHLQNAWNRYGKENFVFWIVEKIDISCLLNREQFYIDMFRTFPFGLYNKCFIAGNTFGIRFNLSEESKRKIGEANKGNQSWLGGHHTEESKRKISKAKIGFHHSEMTKSKMSIAQKDRWSNRKHNVI